MYCPNCGKELNGDVLFCPHCGTALDQFRSAADQPRYAPDDRQPPVPPQPKSDPADGYATASQICGILSVVLCCSPGLLSIAAIVLGFVAKSQGNRSKKATAGIILGFVGLALSVLLVVIYLSVYMNAAFSYPMSDFYYSF